MRNLLLAATLILAALAPVRAAGPISGNGAAPVTGSAALIPVLQAYFATQRVPSEYSPLARISHLKLEYAHDRAVAKPLLDALASAGVTADSKLDDRTVEKAYLSAHSALNEAAMTLSKQAESIEDATDLKELARGLRESDTYGAVYLDAWNHRDVVKAQSTVQKAVSARLGRKIQDETRSWSAKGVKSALVLHEGVASEKQYWKHVDNVIDGLHQIAGKVEKAARAGDANTANAGLEGANFLVQSAERAIAAGRKSVTISHPETSRYYAAHWEADATMRNNTFDSKGRARYEVLKEVSGDVAGIAAVKAKLEGVPGQLAAAQDLKELKEQRVRLQDAIALHYKLYSRMPGDIDPRSDSWLAYVASDKKRIADESKLKSVDGEIKVIYESFPELKPAPLSPVVSWAGAAASVGAFAWSVLAPLDKVFVTLQWTAEAKPQYLSLLQTLANHPLRMALFLAAPIAAALLIAVAMRKARKP